MMPQRYLLQPSDIPNHWVCTDTINRIVGVFENKRFNDTQKFTQLQDFNPADFMKLARYMREMGDWLSENHYEKLF